MKVKFLALAILTIPLAHATRAPASSMARKTHVQNIFRKNLPSITQCLSKNRRHKKDGHFTLYFQINPNGLVQRVGLGESKLPMKDKVCLIETVYNLVFPTSLAQNILRVQQPIYY